VEFCINFHKKAVFPDLCAKRFAKSDSFVCHRSRCGRGSCPAQILLKGAATVAMSTFFPSDLIYLISLISLIFAAYHTYEKRAINTTIIQKDVYLYNMLLICTYYLERCQMVLVSPLKAVSCGLLRYAERSLTSSAHCAQPSWTSRKLLRSLGFSILPRWDWHTTLSLVKQATQAPS